MSEKPTAAFVVSLIAGIFILLNGIVIAAIGAVLAVFMPGAGIVLAAVGLIFGIIVIIGAALMWMNPSMHVGAGVIVLLFSLFSIVIGGGFIIGLILGIVGGILGIIYKPPAPMQAGMMQQMPPSMPPQ